VAGHFIGAQTRRVAGRESESDICAKVCESTDLARNAALEFKEKELSYMSDALSKVYLFACVVIVFGRPSA
jgi:hypothetical protein